MSSFRDAIQRLSTPWLLGPNLSRYLYALSAPFDAMGDAFSYAVRCQEPGHDSEADAYLGIDRGIIRGPAETAAQYAARLRSWQEAKAKAGTVFELARQLSGYLQDDSGASLPIQIITDQGALFEIASDGTETYGAAAWSGTDWDSVDNWARFWIVVDCSGRYTRATEWGINGDRALRSVGSDMPVSVCAALRTLADSWRAAHARLVSVVLVFSDSGTLAPSDWARLGDRDGMFCYFGE